MSKVANPSQWVRDDILALSAYPVPSSLGFIKLDAMENPYTWPESLKQNWLQKLGSVDVNRYPDPQAEGVKQRLREAMGIDERFEILLGNGSDEIIQLIALALAKPGATILAPEPSFVMYKMIATFAQMTYRGFALNPDFSLDREAFLNEIDATQPAVVFLAQPNNPTGTIYQEQDLKAILDRAPGLVVIDEAYMAFSDCDSLPLLEQYPNLVVMRTVSKMGLAGLRLGFLVGDKQWLAEFEKIRLPYNINVLTQASAEFALEHYDVLQEQAQTICEERQQLRESLLQIEGLEVFQSHANFLLVRTPESKARDLFEGLKAQKVLIKCLDGAHPLLKDCLRVTVGTPQENQAFMQAFTKALASL